MKIETDLHVHTTASGHAFSTVNEIVYIAKQKGLKAIALTDHGPAMPGGAHSYHFWNLKILPDFIDGIRVYKGIEANIVNDMGKLDLDEIVIKELDLVIISVHGNCGLEFKDMKSNTDVILRALKNPQAKILAHPGNPQFPINNNAVVEAAIEYNVAIEINNSSLLKTSARLGSEKNCLEIAKIAAELGAKVVVTSDAHYAPDVGNFNQALNIVDQAKIDIKNVVNNTMENTEQFIHGN